MLLLIDACAAINLHNGGKLSMVCGAAGYEIELSPIVVTECGLACASELLALQSSGLIKFVQDSDIPVGRFLELVAEHDIGDGELEAIALCEGTERMFCTDDARARRLATELLGPEKVMGCLRLLKATVQAEVLSCDDAFFSYLKMKDAGGFLPTLNSDFFCGEESC